MLRARHLPRATRHALHALLIYGSLCAVVGEWFPFTRVPMYAVLRNQARSQAAVPVVLVDGERADIRHYERFAGPDPADIEPWYRCRANGVCRSYPSSDGTDTFYAAWVRDHRARADDPPGPVRVDIGYLLLTARPDGRTYDEELEVVWSGTAWPVGR